MEYCEASDESETRRHVIPVEIDGSRTNAQVVNNSEVLGNPLGLMKPLASVGSIEPGWQYPKV